MPTPTTARGYQLPHEDNVLAVDVHRITAAVTAIDADITALESGNKTLGGTKTFSVSPVIPTPAPGDSTTKAASTAFVAAAVTAAINALVAAAPGALDTLDELAAALGDDANFAATITAALAGKADAAAMTSALAAKAALSHNHTASQVSGGPAFSVYLNSTQTVSNGVATKITLNAETFDPDNAFDAVTNYRFQPTLAGYYFFTGRLTGAAATAGTVMNAHLYKNGSLVKNGQPYIPPSGSSSMTVTISGLVYLNGSTDYLELWGTNSGSGTNTFSSGSSESYFDGYFVRP